MRQHVYLWSKGLKESDKGSPKEQSMRNSVENHSLVSEKNTFEWKVYRRTEGHTDIPTKDTMPYTMVPLPFGQWG